MRQYEHRGLAGCVVTRTNRATGSQVSVYNAQQADLCADGGAWVTVCETHSNTVGHSTLRLALSHLGDPAGWCEDCPDSGPGF
jgi:hypothetical protein